MELTTKETTLVEAFRRLSASAAEEIAALIARLAAVPVGSRINWSDSWSEEDLRDFRARSLERVD